MPLLSLRLIGYFFSLTGLLIHLGIQLHQDFSNKQQKNSQSTTLNQAKQDESEQDKFTDNKS